MEQEATVLGEARRRDYLDEILRTDGPTAARGRYLAQFDLLTACPELSADVDFAEVFPANAAPPGSSGTSSNGTLPPWSFIRPPARSQPPVGRARGCPAKPSLNWHPARTPIRPEVSDRAQAAKNPLRYLIY